MAKQLDWSDLNVPRLYPQTWLRIIAQRGGDTTAMLAAANLASDFAYAPKDINNLQMLQLIHNALNQVGDHGIGIDIGLSLPPTAFGSFGYALLSCATMRDAMAICERFWQLAGPQSRVEHELVGDSVKVTLRLVRDLPEPLPRLICESAMASVSRGISLLADIAPSELEIGFAFPPPPHANYVREQLHHVVWDTEEHYLKFPAFLADMPLKMHNPTALQFAIEQCERELALTAPTVDAVSMRVRELLRFDGNDYPSLLQISETLAMTSRTLRRRLEQEGTSFKQLMEAAKSRDALRLLDDPQLEIQQVAERLGYRDPANFTRAFRQWTGQTPSQYRTTRSAG